MNAFGCDKILSDRCSPEAQKCEFVLVLFLSAGRVVMQLVMQKMRVGGRDHEHFVLGARLDQHPPRKHPKLHVMAFRPAAPTRFRSPACAADLGVAWWMIGRCRTCFKLCRTNVFRESPTTPAVRRSGPSEKNPPPFSPALTNRSKGSRAEVGQRLLVAVAVVMTYWVSLTALIPPCEHPCQGCLEQIGLAGGVSSMC